MIVFSNVSREVLGLVVSGFIISFTMSVGMGANDVANAFGTTYGAKLMTIMQIIIVASIFEVTGALLIGTHVADTIRKGIVNATTIEMSYRMSENCIKLIDTNQSELFNISVIEPNKLYCPEMIQMIGSVSALSGSSVWMIIANVARLPVSTTHSIVGSTIGCGLVSLHGKGINWKKLLEIVASWFLSPCISGLVTIALWNLIFFLILKHSDSFGRGLKYMPGFYFVTVFFIMFSVFYKGSELLYLDRIPLWGVLILCFAVSILVSVLIYFFHVPSLRRKYSPSQSTISSIPTNFATMKTRRDTLVEDETQNNFEFQESQAAGDEEKPPNIIDELSKDRRLHSTAGDVPPTDHSEKFGSSRSFDEDPKTSLIFRYMQIIIACYGSFAHGGNDVSNSVAPLMNIWLIYSGGRNRIITNKEMWLLFYGAVGIVIGLALWGKRVLKTVGKDISRITPSMAYAIEMGSVLTVIVLTRFKLPVSTTHCKIGSVISLGIMKYGFRSINIKLIVSILLSWLVTVPASGLMSAAFFAIIQRIIFKS